MDQKVTTHRCSPNSTRATSTSSPCGCAQLALTRHIDALPATSLAHRPPRPRRRLPPAQVVDEETTLSDYPGTVRQLIVRGLGRDAPTVIITNDRTRSAKTDSSNATPAA